MAHWAAPADFAACGADPCEGDAVPLALPLEYFCQEEKRS
jgi:hypothetical protein